MPREGSGDTMASGRGGSARSKGSSSTFRRQLLSRNHGHGAVVFMRGGWRADARRRRRGRMVAGVLRTRIASCCGGAQPCCGKRRDRSLRQGDEASIARKMGPWAQRGSPAVSRSSTVRLGLRDYVVEGDGHDVRRRWGEPGDNAEGAVLGYLPVRDVVGVAPGLGRLCVAVARQASSAKTQCFGGEARKAGPG